MSSSPSTPEIHPRYDPLEFWNPAQLEEDSDDEQFAQGWWGLLPPAAIEGVCIEYNEGDNADEDVENQETVTPRVSRKRSRSIDETSEATTDAQQRWHAPETPNDTDAQLPMPAFSRSDTMSPYVNFHIPEETRRNYNVAPRVETPVQPLSDMEETPTSKQKTERREFRHYITPSHQAHMRRQMSTTGNSPSNRLPQAGGHILSGLSGRNLLGDNRELAWDVSMQTPSPSAEQKLRTPRQIMSNLRKSTSISTNGDPASPSSRTSASRGVATGWTTSGSTVGQKRPSNEEQPLAASGDATGSTVDREADSTSSVSKRRRRNRSGGLFGPNPAGERISERTSDKDYETDIESTPKVSRKGKAPQTTGPGGRSLKRKEPTSKDKRRSHSPECPPTPVLKPKSSYQQRMKEAREDHSGRRRRESSYMSDVVGATLHRQYIEPVSSYARENVSPSATARGGKGKRMMEQGRDLSSDGVEVDDAHAKTPLARKEARRGSSVNIFIEDDPEDPNIPIDDSQHAESITPCGEGPPNRHSQLSQTTLLHILSSPKSLSPTQTPTTHHPTRRQSTTSPSITTHPITTQNDTSPSPRKRSRETPSSLPSPEPSDPINRSGGGRRRRSVDGDGDGDPPTSPLYSSSQPSYRASQEVILEFEHRIGQYSVPDVVFSDEEEDGGRGVVRESQMIGEGAVEGGFVRGVQSFEFEDEADVDSPTMAGRVEDAVSVPLSQEPLFDDFPDDLTAGTMVSGVAGVNEGDGPLEEERELREAEGLGEEIANGRGGERGSSPMTARTESSVTTAGSGGGGSERVVGSSPLLEDRVVVEDMVGRPEVAAQEGVDYRVEEQDDDDESPEILKRVGSAIVVDRMQEAETSGGRFGGGEELREVVGHIEMDERSASSHLDREKGSVDEAASLSDAESLTALPVEPGAVNLSDAYGDTGGFGDDEDKSLSFDNDVIIPAGGSPSPASPKSAADLEERASAFRAGEDEPNSLTADPTGLLDETIEIDPAMALSSTAHLENVHDAPVEDEPNAAESNDTLPLPSNKVSQSLSTDGSQYDFGDSTQFYREMPKTPPLSGAEGHQKEVSQGNEDNDENEASQSYEDEGGTQEWKAFPLTGVVQGALETRPEEGGGESIEKGKVDVAEGFQSGMGKVMHFSEDARRIAGEIVSEVEVGDVRRGRVRSLPPPAGLLASKGLAELSQEVMRGRGKRKRSFGARGGRGRGVLKVGSFGVGGGESGVPKKGGGITKHPPLKLVRRPSVRVLPAGGGLVAAVGGVHPTVNEGMSGVAEGKTGLAVHADDIRDDFSKAVGGEKSNGFMPASEESLKAPSSAAASVEWAQTLLGAPGQLPSEEVHSEANPRTFTNVDGAPKKSSFGGFGTASGKALKAVSADKYREAMTRLEGGDDGVGGGKDGTEGGKVALGGFGKASGKALKAVSADKYREAMTRLGGEDDVVGDGEDGVGTRKVALGGFGTASGKALKAVSADKYREAMTRLGGEDEDGEGGMGAPKVALGGFSTGAGKVLTEPSLAARRQMAGIFDDGDGGSKTSGGFSAVEAQPFVGPSFVGGPKGRDAVDGVEGRPGGEGGGFGGFSTARGKGLMEPSSELMKAGIDRFNDMAGPLRDGMKLGGFSSGGGKALAGVSSEAQKRVLGLFDDIDGPSVSTEQGDRTLENDGSTRLPVISFGGRDTFESPIKLGGFAAATGRTIPLSDAARQTGIDFLESTDKLQPDAANLVQKGGEEGAVHRPIIAPVPSGFALASGKKTTPLSAASKARGKRFLDGLEEPQFGDDGMAHQPLAANEGKILPMAKSLRGVIGYADETVSPAEEGASNINPVVQGDWRNANAESGLEDALVLSRSTGSSTGSSDQRAAAPMDKPFTVPVTPTAAARDRMPPSASSGKSISIPKTPMRRLGSGIVPSPSARKLKRPGDSTPTGKRLHATAVWPSPRVQRSDDASEKSEPAVALFNLDGKCQVARQSLREALGTPLEEQSYDELREAGIPEEVIFMNSKAAETFVFQQSFEGDPDDGSTPEIGKDAYERKLIELGANPNLATTRWVGNHYKWIVWKLACFVRRAPSRMRNLFTPDEVLRQLLYRYEREINRAQRSALKSIIERDDIPGKQMVLCVSDVLKNNSDERELQSGDVKPSVIGDNSTTLELTDGWICGAQMTGPTDARDALEVSSETRLKLIANGTRRARWDAKLGYQREARFGLGIRQLKPGGGAVPYVDVIVMRKYPILYMDRLVDGSRITRNEKEEAVALQAWQNAFAVTYEKHAAAVDKESASVTTKAKRTRRRLPMKVADLLTGPELLAEMSRWPDTESFMGQLNKRQTEQLQECMQERRLKQQAANHENIQNRVDEEFPPREVVPLLRLRVCDYPPEGIPKDATAEALLTIWRPDEVHLEGMQEGKRYRIYNLLVKEARQARWAVELSSQGTCHIAEKTTREDRMNECLYRPRAYLGLGQLFDVRSGDEVDVIVLLMYQDEIKIRYQSMETGLMYYGRTLLCTDSSGAVAAIDVRSVVRSHIELKVDSILCLRNLEFSYYDEKHMTYKLKLANTTEIRTNARNDTERQIMNDLMNWKMINPQHLDDLKAEHSDTLRSLHTYSGGPVTPRKVTTPARLPTPFLPNTGPPGSTVRQIYPFSPAPSLTRKLLEARRTGSQQSVYDINCVTKTGHLVSFDRIRRALVGGKGICIDLRGDGDNLSDHGNDIAWASHVLSAERQTVHVLAHADDGVNLHGVQMRATDFVKLLQIGSRVGSDYGDGYTDQSRLVRKLFFWDEDKPVHGDGRWESTIRSAIDGQLHEVLERLRPDQMSDEERVLHVLGGAVVLKHEVLRDRFGKWSGVEDVEMVDVDWLQEKAEVFIREGHWMASPGGVQITRAGSVPVVFEDEEWSRVSQRLSDLVSFISFQFDINPQVDGGDGDVVSIENVTCLSDKEFLDSIIQELEEF
ncbi:Breast cancer 2, early onset [Rhizophlyctis rosea]|nr:Breast cancer 2, early onset [Rhizophlyctis rosea]